MTGRRAGLGAALVIVAMVLQTAIVTRIPFPGGVAPDLVILVVAAWAVRTGPLSGCVAGFGAGLLADIVPPAFHAIGRFALIYCVVGYLVGLVSAEAEDSAAVSSLAVAVGALVATFLSTMLGAVLADPAVVWDALARVMPGAALYDLLGAPFAWYAVARLVDRLTPAQVGPARHPPAAWRGGYG